MMHCHKHGGWSDRDRSFETQERRASCLAFPILHCVYHAFCPLMKTKCDEWKKVLMFDENMIENAAPLNMRVDLDKLEW